MIELLKFNDFGEFISRRKHLRIYYTLLSTPERAEYKKYIYKLKIKMQVLDVIWRYFNEPKGSTYYVFDYQLMEYAKLYARNKNNIEL